MTQLNTLRENPAVFLLAKNLAEHQLPTQWSTARVRLCGLILTHDGQSPSDLVEYYRQLSLGPTHEIIHHAIYGLSNEGVIEWNPVRLKYVFTEPFRELLKERDRRLYTPA